MQRLSELNHESRFEAILSSVNTEFKSVTLGYCLDESWKSSTEMKNSYSSFLEGSGVKVPSHMNFSDYCHHTFHPIGLVIEERMQRKEPFKYVTSWKLSEDGISYGQPSAALAIQTANEFNTSLYKILGPTNSPGDSRSPYNRAKILMHLDNVKKARKRDLSNISTLDESGILEHCKNLSKIGFIEYEGQDTEEKGWSRYKWIEGKKAKDVTLLRGYHSVTLKVSELMEKTSKDWDYNEISEKLNYDNPSHISQVLSHLKKLNFVKRVSKFKGGEKLSEAKITEEGRRFIDIFLNPVFEALNPNVDEVCLEEFREVHNSYLNNLGLLRNHIVNATELYSLVSPRLKGMPRVERESQVIKLLREEGRLRAKDIKERLGVKCVWSRYITPLVTRNILQKENKGKAVYYSLA